MIIEKLRAATGPVHQELDASLMPVFKATDTKEKYGRLLRGFYGFFQPVTALIDKHLDKTYLTDYSERRRPATIINDLQALQLPAEDIAAAVQLPVISNRAAAFGAYYVLEGSTLGGVYLSKMLAEQLQIDENSGLSFFYGYGKMSRERWNVFVDALNRFAAASNEEDAITNAAIETFALFKIHLEKLTVHQTMLTHE
ncbi:MAG: biliverdin-producing heme oxygenase [Ferruginibacter sp.]